ncbi:hypothetical protein JTE90_024805 [Oedothorax gibbosus]|uniref:SH3 domain-containing protein n=1 Tax=Oedothorax gibbosus TaxID=931172 RepID=A0AAV6UQC2_9ARAC|nr:hypothetical protein JTE90_024805 [Oedothorax gibbosus]
MADDSPGKVQALRAIFADKNAPLMGMMPPAGKGINRPWKTSFDSAEETISFKERIISEQRLSSTQLITKVLPVPAKRPESNPTPNGIELHKNVNGFSEKTLEKIQPRPNVGPKPAHLFQQLRNKSPVNGHPEATSNLNGTKESESRTLAGDDSGLSKSRAVAETIASFMFANGCGPNRTADPVPNSVQPPVPKPRNAPQTLLNHHRTKDLIESEKTDSQKLDNLLNSDNYICKGSCNFKRKELPSLEVLGPPPSKPSKPPHMVLPAKYRVLPECPSVSVPLSLPPPTTSPPTVPHRPAPQRPAYPCPPRPHTPPPLPPVSSVASPATKQRLSLREEIEELYEDTLLGENKRPVSLIPEFTAEEEEAEELYNDADIPSPLLPLLKPKDPPPPCPPSEYLQPNVHNTDEELYQDADDIDEEFYEEMPCDMLLEESGSPLYSNNKKEIERLKREEEKKIRKELKEREKREKEMEKLKRKFGLNGDEIPIDDGLVKTDSKGGKGGDLPVRKGETVLILRMEGNPSGRWLVKNEKGKIGYVELTNIEVDPLSVKSVMTIRRQSVISASEELYCEAKSEEEGIYETTY